MRPILAVVFFLLFLLSPKTVSAHPLDEISTVTVYDQKHSLTVGPQETTLQVTMTFFALEKVKVWESLDQDKDQAISAEERARWINLGKSSSWLESGNQKYFFTPTGAQIPDYYQFFSPAPAAITVLYRASPPVRPNEEISYHYAGKDKKLAEIAKEIHAAGGWSVTGLTQTNPDAISFRVQPGQGNSAVLDSQSRTRLGAFLEQFVKIDRLSPTLTVFALITALILGALHALTPGHGKAIAAGYLVGTRGTILHAISLGLIITFTHTASVFLLGGASLFLTQYIVPEKIIRLLASVSGFMVLALGLSLLTTRGGKLLSDHSDPHPHDHQATPGISWLSLVSLGISGGIVPCVDALAILIVAISLGRILFGLSLLVAFSLGLAATLVISGVLVVTLKQRARLRFAGLSHYEGLLGIISALVVTLLGLGLVFNLSL